VEQDAGRGTECAAGTALVVDVVPVFHVRATGEQQVVNDAPVRVRIEDRPANPLSTITLLEAAKAIVIANMAKADMRLESRESRILVPKPTIRGI